VVAALLRTVAVVAVVRTAVAADITNLRNLPTSSRGAACCAPACSGVLINASFFLAFAPKLPRDSSPATVFYKQA